MVIRGSGPKLISELSAQSPELVFLIQIYSIILPIRVVAFSHSLSSSLSWAASSQAAMTGTGSLKSSFFVNMAQI